MDARQQNLFEPVPAPWELDEQGDQSIATVVLPEVPFGPFDYRIPTELMGEVEIGRRLRVPLGRGNRAVVGYCVHVSHEPAGRARSHRLKDVRAVIDAGPLVPTRMLELTKWMSEYYLCPWGQVLEGVIPAGVRSQAGTRQVAYLSVPNNVIARITQLKLPAKQANALRMLAASPKPLTAAELASKSGCTTAPIKALERKGLLRSEHIRVHLADHDLHSKDRVGPPSMNPHQESALRSILDAMRSQCHETILLHGVTGSGKTEVYMRAIAESVSYGRQAIVLVPEISLTPQTVARFRARFDRIAVLHSHLTPSERHWHWRSIARGEIQVVVGARSAVFAPAPHLGLIVLDEEHDASFKQDTVPRYHARDVALERARRERIPVVLGSATPSLESWRHAKQKVFRLVELPVRVLDRPLPDVGIIDLRNEFQNRRVRGAISRPLKQTMEATLQGGGQVILLLNRRGFSTSIQCPACGYVVRCKECDIALTHHRAGEKAICHYCDYQIAAPVVCPECRFDGIRYAGLGTQRLEAEVQSRFPKYECLRMDSDTMQKPGSHEAAFARFRAGEVQILLGTQMIAKGLDFPNVTLVGVINADTALHFPDFRAGERTFQLVTQVAGRTGRGEMGGRVLVQTSSPEHPAILAAMRHDYHEFAATELPIREQYGYPPFAPMVRLIIRGPDETTTEQFAERIVEDIQNHLDSINAEARVLGPAPAPISKLRGKFRFHVLLFGAADDGGNVSSGSGGQEASEAPGRDAIHEAVAAVAARIKAPEDVQWVVDVDPIDML